MGEGDHKMQGKGMEKDEAKRTDPKPEQYLFPVFPGVGKGCSEEPHSDTEGHEEVLSIQRICGMGEKNIQSFHQGQGGNQHGKGGEVLHEGLFSPQL